ncbi:MAG: HAD hydrolase family protein, partial [Nitrososphaerota archaeon]|nr:HAD hydrolase family protein [Nitrososphaerota archaeon]
MAGLVLDVDGTLVRGRKVIEGALEALTALRQMGYQLVLCTQENQLSDRDIA